MKTRFKLAAAALAAIAAFAQTASAATAAEIFRGFEADIATNRCVAVGGYVFGVGRAISQSGGDSVGFGKARLLAFGKIADMARELAKWPEACPENERREAWRLLVADKALALSPEGCEIIVEKSEGDGRFMAVIAIRKENLLRAIPKHESLGKYLTLARMKGADAESDMDATPPIIEYEPRGYWEENGVKANETLSEAQFL